MVLIIKMFLINQINKSKRIVYLELMLKITTYLLDSILIILSKWDNSLRINKLIHLLKNLLRLLILDQIMVQLICLTKDSNQIILVWVLIKILINPLDFSTIRIIISLRDYLIAKMQDLVIFLLRALRISQVVYSTIQLSH